MVAYYRHNYPIDAFDGWWLSMEPHHTFSAHSAEMENVRRGAYWNPHSSLHALRRTFSISAEYA